MRTGVIAADTYQMRVTGRRVRPPAAQIPLRLLCLLTCAAWLTIPALAGDFEFVVIGDTRPTFESESFRPFESLIARINDLNPALVVNVGDLIYGYGPASKAKQWDKYEAVIKRFRVPYHQLPGNHDTHSREARRIYGHRFGKFYQSFDFQDCHFVLLDNTEQQRWGFMGSAELNWLKEDLKQTQANSVFVFMHFPVWEPERITPEYYDFWSQTLHPLFKASRVRAVFGGHYHTYGPTREFDGIRYFITGGGGAELRPEYIKSGGQHHFMRVKVAGNAFSVSVVTERGELSDSDADVMGGLQFAARNVSRIGVKRDPKDLRAGASFSITVNNPYLEAMNGTAAWVFDNSVFSVEPPSVPIQILAGEKRQYTFTLRALQDATTLQSLPRLQFNVVSGGRRRKFHRELRFVQELNVPSRKSPPRLDGQMSDWDGMPTLELGNSSAPAAELRAFHDTQNLYLALSVPAFDADEAKEFGFTDELQIGIARLLSPTDFGGDFLRLGFNSDSTEARNQTPGRKQETSIPGVKCVAKAAGGKMTYEIEVPLRLLRTWRTGMNRRFILDLSFPPPESPTDVDESSEPARNSLSYRIRYGSDSLVPVYFVQLTVER